MMNWVLLEMVANKSVLCIVEERLNWTKELFCWSYVKLLRTCKEWLENNCGQCYSVLPQLLLNPQRTVHVTLFQGHSVFCSSSDRTEASVLVCAVKWGLVWIGFVRLFSRWLPYSLQCSTGTSHHPPFLLKSQWCAFHWSGIHICCDTNSLEQHRILF